jgi:hypothetical protein
VKAALDKVAQGYARRDLALSRATFGPDPDVVMRSTEADEKRVGLAEIQKQVERNWSQSTSADLTYRWTSVSVAGSVASEVTDAAFTMKTEGREITLPVRITFVLENHGKEWLNIQAHFSFPTAGQAADESFLHSERVVVDRPLSASHLSSGAYLAYIHYTENVAWRFLEMCGRLFAIRREMRIAT